MPCAESDSAGSGRGFVAGDTVARGKINFAIGTVEGIYVPRKTRGSEAALLVGPNGLNVCRSAGQDVDPCGKSKCVAEIDVSGIQKLRRAVELHAMTCLTAGQNGGDARQRRVLAGTIQIRKTGFSQMPDEQVIGGPNGAIG